MIFDKARKITDKKLKAIEKKIAKVYKKARAGIADGFQKYMGNAASRLEKLQSEYELALKAGETEAIKAANEKLTKAKENITFRDKRYRAMVEDTTERITEANIAAIAYANGVLPYVYSVNFNQVSEQAKQFGIRFDIVNENTVKNLIKKGDVKLPTKKVAIAKDMKWNTKQINSSVFQGILQGESMDKIAKRIMPIVDNNKTASIRTARTLVTGAENDGRLDSYKDLQDRGVVLNKVWIATHDSRTREAHLYLDGKETSINGFFVDSDGNELEYPGDPYAPPETVYNCRCSMATHIVGFVKSDGHIEYV